MVGQAVVVAAPDGWVNSGRPQLAHTLICGSTSFMARAKSKNPWCTLVYDARTWAPDRGIAPCNAVPERGLAAYRVQRVEVRLRAAVGQALDLGPRPRPDGQCHRPCFTGG